MQCLDMEYLLSSYLDRELPPDEADLVEKHLKQCPSCREVFADLQETSSLIRSLPDVPMPSGFQEQLRQRLVQAHQELFGQEEGQIKERENNRNMRKVRNTRSVLSDLFSPISSLFRSYRWATVMVIVFLCLGGYNIFSLNNDINNDLNGSNNLHKKMSLAESTGDTGRDATASEQAPAPEEASIAMNAELAMEPSASISPDAGGGAGAEESQLAGKEESQVDGGQRSLESPEAEMQEFAVQSYGIQPDPVESKGKLAFYCLLAALLTVLGAKISAKYRRKP
mgnify:CR=1 FL=1